MNIRNNVTLFLLFFFICTLSQAQIYKHDFGSTTITAYPYTVAPSILNTNLNTSSWTNSIGSWTSNTGATGQAIMVNTPAGSTTLTLTFNVATGYAATITAFDFWSRRSNSGPQNWSMTINGTTVGSGSVTTAGAALGSTPVSTAITGLTGTVTVVLTASNATGGNIRLDDFTLYGSVVSNCNGAVVTNFTPATGAINTGITFTGTGFGNTTSVTYEGVAATFTVVSDTSLIVFVPDTVVAGDEIIITANGCPTNVVSTFSPYQSICGSQEIYISEVYDAFSGSPGAIELYNPSPIAVTFNDQYVLERYGNIGDATPTTGYVLTLPGSIAGNSTYLVSSGPAPCSITADATMGSGINANDEFKLWKSGTLIDNLQVPLGNGATTGIGYTIIRKPDAVAPQPVFNVNDWNVYDTEFCSDLGTHTANPSSGAIPDITQPQSVTVCEGANAVFTIAVTGTGYAYQWRMLNASGMWVDVTNNTTYSGVATAQLTITNATAALNYSQYYCFITSDSCTIYSNAAMLTVGGTLAAPTGTVTDAGCSTGGQFTVTSPTGAGVTYSIDGGAYVATTTFTDLATGSHNIIAKNASGCTSAPFNFTVQPYANTPAVPDATITQPVCGDTTGNITVTSPTGAYTYSLDGGAYQSSVVFNSVASGTHNITVKNTDGCTTTGPDIVIDAAPTVPATPVVTIVQPDCTTPIGSITVVSPVGAGYEYSLNSGAYQSSTTFTGLVPNNYTITVKNSSNCTASTTATINTVPTAPATPQLTAAQPDCTTTTGSITVTSPTGAGYQYSLNGGAYQTSTIFSGLSANNYSVTVQNAAGCTAISSSITINAAPTIPAVPQLSATQPDCTTAGSITVTSPTGAGYQYSLNGGTYQTSTTFNNLSANSYTVTIQNATGCTAVSSSVTINAAPAVPAAPQFSIVHPDCVTTSGSVTVVSPTGAGYQYSIDGGAFQTSVTFSPVSSGNHTITVKNASNCTSSGTATINAIPTPPSTPQLSVVQPDCSNPASITVTSPTGTGYQYSLNGGAYQASPVFSSLTPNSYTVTVKNTAGCTTASSAVTINAGPVAPATPQLSATQPDCVTTTGTITVVSPVGSSYQYSLDGGTYQSSVTFTSVTPGSHTVTVKNTSNCTSTAGIVINNIPTPPATPVLAVTQPTCSVATGSITVTSPVGAGYQYSLNGGAYQNSTTFSLLSANSYTVTVKNAAGCTSVSALVTINTAPASPTAPVVTITQPDCTTATGSMTVTSPIGTGYEYSVDNGAYQTSVNFSVLSPGYHNIKVRNADGCVSVSTTFFIKNAPATPAVPQLTVTQPNCNVTTGKIVVNSPVGVGYSYSTDGITYQPSPVFSGLATGTYTVTVKNDAGCTAISASVIINAAPAPAPAPGTITGNNGVCIDDTLQLTNTVTGGVWSVSNTSIATIDATGLVTPIHAGTVIVYYTVGTICTDFTQKTITVYTLPNPHLQDVYLCENNVNHLITDPKTLDTELNNTDYSFVWDKDGTALSLTTASINVLEPGVYTVTVTNIVTGCSAISQATVGISSIALATAQVGEDFQKNQAVYVTVAGGSGDYVFSIDGGSFQDSPVFTGVSQGEHIITVNDVNGCGSIDITVFALDYPRFFSPNNDGKHDTWNIPGLSTQTNSYIHIFDRYGKLITSILPSSHGWDGTLNGYPLPATDYWFVVNYRSSNGSIKEFRAHFSLLR
ncbi:T9SS type B sorting domain-containing protein [Flavobacterium sp. RHBU_3]|uniref:T9SS type B sorting domain-containing protein n=1 Tax=Flavobacterium sp. RHBU_3 TaxID=3391184 RepID=UPI003984C348